MPIFSPVAAGPVQTSTSSSPSARSTSGSTNESFASHLKAANGKKANAQNSSQSRDRANHEVEEKPVAETTKPSPTGKKEKVAKQQVKSDKRTPSDTPAAAEQPSVPANVQASDAAANQPSIPANVLVSDAATTSALEAPTRPSKSTRESMVGLLLSSISKLPVNSGKNDAPITADTNNTGKTDTGLSFLHPDVPLAQTALSESAALPVAPDQTLSSPAEPAINGTLQQTQGNVPSGTNSTATTIIFDPRDGSITTTAHPLPDSAEETIDSSMLLQNEDGQIITVEQNKATLPGPVETTTVNASQLVHRDSNNFDLNGHYLHSHLPNGTVSKGATASENSLMNNEQSQSNLPNGNNQSMNSMGLEQQGTIQDATIQPQNTQHLSFGYQLNTAQTGTASSSPTPSENTFYQLGSGNIVPDSTAVDQMIAHFSVNNRLQSGTVNLKLYPQELGELRMEIKVEQDNVKAHIVAQSPHAQEMIDRHMPRLREALEQQGLNLQQIDVTVAANDNASGEPFQDSSAWQNTQQSLSPKSRHAEFNLELEEETVDDDQTNNNLNVIA